MLHEIIFALMGKPGGIIIETMDGFVVDTNLDIITKPERELINKLVILGYYFARIERFLDENH